MALLRMSDGRVYTAIDDINALIAPMQIGAFDFPDESSGDVQGWAQPISKEQAHSLGTLLDGDTAAWLKDEQFISWRVGNVVNEQDGSFSFYQHFEDGNLGSNQKSAEEMASYLVPHKADVDDVHFVFSGAIIKGVQLAGDLQGAVYVLPGEWIRIGPKAVNWPIFPSGEATVGLSYFSKPATATPSWVTKQLPDVQIHPAMRF